MELFAQYDLIVDGTDNFATRYLVNDAAVLLDKPYVWGSIYRFDGQASVFWDRYGPNYRDLYPDPPPPGMVPSCAEGGVLGVLPGVVGTLQATEAVKLLLTQGEQFVNAGDLVTARLLFRRAVEAGDADGALALGATYDPGVLAKLGVRGIAADIEQARGWYEKARDLGSAEASRRLRILANR